MHRWCIATHKRPVIFLVTSCLRKRCHFIRQEQESLVWASHEARIHFYQRDRKSA
jgi:hypothetical protein